MSYAIGVDIGGTAIKFGLVTRVGEILRREKIDFPPDEPFDILVDRIADLCRAIAGEEGTAVTGIGISAPGYAEPGTGIPVEGTANIPNLSGKSILSALERRLHLPVVLENDGIAAALGEMRFGAAKGLRNFVLTTLGTGIGGGIVVNGRVVKGTHGEPPELGALVLDVNGPPNRSGLPGTFEHYACKAGLLNAYRERGGNTEEVADIFARAKDGDAAACGALDQLYLRLAQALSVMVHLLNLDACLIGGGLAENNDALREGVCRHLGRFAMPGLLALTNIRLAERGNDAGLLGAASLLWEDGLKVAPAKSMA